MIERMSLDEMYMKIAMVLAQRSSCNRKKVGAIIVKDRQIISEGYNGTPTGWHTNCCEDGDVTKDVVIHAEMNAILKLARTTQSGDGGTLYVTMSPCFGCSKLIVQAGIERVVYLEDYRITDSFDFLEQSGVIVERFDQISQNSLESEAAIS